MWLQQMTIPTKVKAQVADVCAVAEGKKMFLPGQVSFCRFGSLGLGDLASNSASKIVETSSALGWKHLHCCSCGVCYERVEKWGNGLEWFGNSEMQLAMVLSVVEMRSA